MDRLDQQTGLFQQVEPLDQRRRVDVPSPHQLAKAPRAEEQAEDDPQNPSLLEQQGIPSENHRAVTRPCFALMFVILHS